MNYYERHIGDYLKDTSHLSLLEHGVYTRLLDVYYTREGAVPDEQAARLIGARSKDEREALRAVLLEFFERTNDGWVQTRCEREIGRFQEKAPEREAKRENDRERQRRARERRATLFKELRQHNIIPPFDAKTHDLETLLSRAKSQVVTPTVTPTVTRDNTATQSPYPVPKKNTGVVTPPPDGVSPSTWTDFLKLRKAKKAPMTDTALQGIRLEAGKAGLTLEEALQTCCKRGWQGFEAGWINGNHKPTALQADDWTRTAK